MKKLVLILLFMSILIGDTNISISGSMNHTVAIDRSGKVYGWGSNSNNKLFSSSSAINYSSPQELTSLSNVKDIKAGESFTVYLREDGTVFHQGNIGGIGTVLTTPSQVYDTSVTPLSGIVQIDVGQDFAIALKDDGSLYVWGEDPRTFNYDIKAQLVVQNSNIIQIAAGDMHVLYLVEGTSGSGLGTVYAFGQNGSYQCGLSVPSTISTSPMQITSLGSTVSYISAGGSYSAVIKGGNIFTFGNGTDGKLGNGTYVNSTNAQVLNSSNIALSNIEQVSLGSSHALALDNSGNVWVWGKNNSGQTYIYYDAGIDNNHYSKAQQTSLSDIVKIEAANNYSLSVNSNGKIITMGENGLGQLGIGNAFIPGAPTTTISIDLLNNKPQIISSKSFSADEDISFSFPIEILETEGDTLSISLDSYESSWLSIDDTFTIDTLSGDGSSDASQLGRVYGIAYSKTTGNIYVADFDWDRVVKVEPDGTRTTILEGTPSFTNYAGNLTVNSLRGVAVDNDENVYVVDEGNYVIYKIKSDGTKELLYDLGTTPGTQSSTGFQNPGDIVTDSIGNLYVTDGAYYNGGTQYPARILKIDSSGIDTVLISSVGASIIHTLSNPTGLGIDSDDNLYIVDSEVVKKVQNDSISTLYTDSDAGTFLWDIDVASNGDIFISDHIDVIHKLDGSTLSVYAGQEGVKSTDSTASNGDGGIPTNATFQNPLYLDVVGSTIYVSDFNNKKIRKIYTKYTLEGTGTNEKVGENNIIISLSDGIDTVDEIVTIDINNTNDAPTDITLSSTSIEENTGINGVVGTLSTIDSDIGDSATYTLVSGSGDTDNGSFNISGTSLKLISSADFETQSSYSIRIRVSDGSGAIYEKTFTISVTNLNETPTDISLSTQQLIENSLIGLEFATLSSSDPDAINNFTYSLVSGTGDSDNGKFTVEGDKLKVLQVPDFDEDSGSTTYSIRVQVSDGEFSLEKSFQLEVLNDPNDDNVAPTDIQLSSVSLNENNQADVIIGNLSSIDPNNGDSFTYSLTCSIAGSDDGSFSISGTSLNTNVIFDYENKKSHSICIRSTDAGGLTYDKNFNISVNNVNEDASVTIDSTMKVIKNSPETISYTYTDEDGDSISATAFINPAFGSLTFGNDSITYSPNSDYLGNDSFVVTFSDGNGYSTNKTIAVTVNEEETEKQSCTNLPSIDSFLVLSSNYVTVDSSVNFYDLSLNGEEDVTTVVKLFNSQNLDDSELTKTNKNDFTYIFDTVGEYIVNHTIKSVDCVIAEANQTVVVEEDSSDLGELIILSGLGDDSSDPMHTPAINLGDLAYRFFLKRGLTHDSIVYLNGNSSHDYDKDGNDDNIIDYTTDLKNNFFSTISSLKSSSSTGPLYIYMVSHGLKDVFLVSSKTGEKIYATEFTNALDTFQNDTGREVVLIMEACYSGSFQDNLENSYKDSRALFFSSSDTQESLLGGNGYVSFSGYLLKDFVKGNTIGGSYNGSKAKVQTFSKNAQSPQFNLSFENINSLKMGNLNKYSGVVTAAVEPTIEITSAPENFNATDSNPLTIIPKVTSELPVRSVWVTITNDSNKPSSSNSEEFFTPTGETITLTSDNNYTLEYPPSVNGEHVVGFFIEDVEGNMVEEFVTVNVSGVIEDTTDESNISINESLNIIEGWNLLSLPVDTTISYSEISSKLPNAQTVWKYSNGWKAYGKDSLQSTLQDAGITQIDTISKEQGFWVNSSTTDTLEVSGNIYDITTSSTLTSASSSWHLLGTGTDTTASSITSINSNISTIWVYDNGWKAYGVGDMADTLSGAGILPLTDINQGQGFWVNIK